MDDCASCLLGGINLADNLGRKIERSKLFDKPLKIVIKVPNSPSRRAAVDVAQVRKLGKVAEVLYKMSMEGDLWRAMTLNGTLYSGIYGYDARAGAARGGARRARSLPLGDRACDRRGLRPQGRARR